MSPINLFFSWRAFQKGVEMFVDVLHHNLERFCCCRGEDDEEPFKVTSEVVCAYAVGEVTVEVKRVIESSSLAV